jgi:ectoine hydroxylase-related dioxygenase (phytanoyl-CoA dioxygenase family)
MSMDTCIEPASIARAAGVAEAKAHLDRLGFTVLEGVLQPAELAAARSALQRVIAQDREQGVKLQGFAFDPDDRNVRAYNLVGRDALFRDLATHPVAMELTRHVLGKRCLLSNLSANVTAPGSGAMDMHADQRGIHRPWPAWPCGLNIGWALDDFTVENGATCVVPRSHLRNEPPLAGYDGDDVLSLTCSAGSLFAIESRLWHRTGANTTRDQHRAAVFAYYVRPFLRTNWNWHRHLSVDEIRTYGSELQQMLGYEADLPY